MSANEWKLELQRLMDLFHRESTISLRKINRCFVASRRSFDEVFRQYFLKLSTNRLNDSFDTILLEQCYDDDDPAQSTSDSSPSTGINDYQNNAIPLNSDEIELLNTLANEIELELNVEIGIDTPIEIADSDEDDGISDNIQAQAANDGFGNQAESNGSEEPNVVQVKCEPKIENDLEMIDLPLVEFDPNKNDDGFSDENGATAMQQLSSDGCRSKTVSKKPHKHFQRNAAGVFKCGDCGYSTLMKHHLKSHRLIHDVDAEIFKCEECDLATRYKQVLKRHQRTHVQQKLMGVTRNPGNGLYKCTRCDQQFSEWHNLKRHLTRIHNNNQLVYNCKHCMRRFTRQNEREKHEVRCQNRLYECYRCKMYMTRYVTHLRDHLLTHSTAKPFKCAICKKVFRQKGHLCRHLNSIHG